MKTYNKFINNPLNKENRLTEFQIQIAEHNCPICRNDIRFAVKEEFIDWKSVAEDYKGMYISALKEIEIIKKLKPNEIDKQPTNNL